MIFFRLLPVDNFLLIIISERKDHILNRQKTVRREKQQTTSDLEVIRITALFTIYSNAFRFVHMIAHVRRRGNNKGFRNKGIGEVERENMCTQGRRESN